MFDAHLADGTDQTGEVQHVALLEEKLGSHRAKEHVPALHGHEVQAVEAAEGRHGLVDDGRFRRHDGTHGEGILDEVVFVVGAGRRVSAAPTAREEKRRRDENVRHAAHRHGHAVQGEREQTHGLRVGVSLAHHALDDQVGGGADEGARAAGDGREGERDHELRPGMPHLRDLRGDGGTRECVLEEKGGRGWVRALGTRGDASRSGRVTVESLFAKSAIFARVPFLQDGNHDRDDRGVVEEGGDDGHGDHESDLGGRGGLRSAE